MNKYFFVGLFICVSNSVAMESIRFKESVSAISSVLKENGYSQAQIEALQDFKLSDITSVEQDGTIYRAMLRDNTEATGMIFNDEVTATRNIEVNGDIRELPINPQYYDLLKNYYEMMCDE